MLQQGLISAKAAPPSPNRRNPQYISSSHQAYGYDPAKANLSRPYQRDMFSHQGNLGKGIASLAGQPEENRRTQATGYQEDYAVVQEYNQMVKQMNEQKEGLP
jgi:hypothetical protein